MIDNNPTAFSHLPSLGLKKNTFPREDKANQIGKVLIVDDELDIVSTLQSYLSERGYKTLGCTSAKSAIDAFKKYEFDLLLVELQLTDSNGIDVLKTALKIDPHLIGIIITGHGTVESALDAMKAGAFDYLLKPFDFKILSPILDRAMKVRGLSKSEDKYRTLVEELCYRIRELEIANDKHSDREIAIYDLREEAEALKEALRRYNDTEKNMFFDGNGSGGY